MPIKIKLVPGRPEIARRALREANRKGIKQPRPKKRKLSRAEIVQAQARGRRLASEKREKLAKLARIRAQLTLARRVVALRLIDFQPWEIAGIVKVSEEKVVSILKACGRIGKRGGYSITKAQHKVLRLNWYIERMIGKRQRTRQGCPFVRAEVLGESWPPASAAKGLEPFDLDTPWPPTMYKWQPSPASRPSRRDAQGPATTSCMPRAPGGSGVCERRLGLSSHPQAISSATTSCSRSSTRKVFLTTPHGLIALKIASLSSVPQV